MHIFGGKYKYQKIVAPKGKITRPSTGRIRQSLFNICQNYIENTRFLDLFAGSGAMGLEALSHGASHVTFIDNQKNAIQCIEINLEKMNLSDRALVLFGDIFFHLKRLETRGVTFDIIYADPPYGSSENQECMSKKIMYYLDQSSLLPPNGMLFIEESSSIDLVTERLTSLELISSRRFGIAALHQFQKKSL